MRDTGHVRSTVSRRVPMVGEGMGLVAFGDEPVTCFDRCCVCAPEFGVMRKEYVMGRWFTRAAAVLASGVLLAACNAGSSGGASHHSQPTRSHGQTHSGGGGGSGGSGNGGGGGSSWA